MFSSNLFNNLTELVKTDDAFFSKDYALDARTYRIFNYRLASWSSFCKLDARNCRGTMFDVTDPETPELVCLPPEKFHNYEEGSVDHTAGIVGDMMVKMDGSLISTYLHNGELRFKSKGSLSSDQALAAMEWINRPENADIKADLEFLTDLKFTVNLEYTSPTNRIVVPYQKDQLTVLSVRSMLTGQTIYGGDLEYMLIGLNRINIKRVLVQYTTPSVVPDQAFVDQTRNEQFGEGYVVEIKTGELSYLIKIKNDRYNTLHLTKDSINSNKRLFEAVIDEVTDDLRAMFSDDQHALDRIDKMERDVQPIFNHIVGTVEVFVDHNKELDRKSFAIKAKAECSSLMGLIMNMYLGHDNDYKTFAKKYRKELFGVTDDVVGDMEE